MLTSTFITVTHKRRGSPKSKQDNIILQQQHADHDDDIHQLSTLAEVSLSLQQHYVTNTSQDLIVYPATAALGKGLYSSTAETAIQTIETEIDCKKLDAAIGTLKMEESFPCDEPPPIPTPFSYLSVAGVPRFPDDTRYKNDDGEERRRRMEIILAQKASIGRQHPKELRKLRRLRRKSVNTAIRDSKRRLLEAMEIKEGKEKYHCSDDDGGNNTNNTTREWKRERSGTAKATDRHRSQCRRRKKSNIHKVKKRVRGWRRLHTRLYKTGGEEQSTTSSSNTSKLGLEDHAKRSRQQRRLNDLQREMSYLGL